MSKNGNIIWSAAIFGFFFMWLMIQIWRAKIYINSKMRDPLWFYWFFSAFCIVGERIAYSVGANFTPHVITVNAGEVCPDKYVWNETWCWSLNFQFPMIDFIIRDLLDCGSNYCFVPASMFEMGGLISDIKFLIPRHMDI